MNKQDFFNSLDTVVQDIKFLTNLVDTMEREPHSISIDLFDNQSLHEMLDDSTMYTIEQMVKADLDRQLSTARLRMITIVE